MSTHALFGGKVRYAIVTLALVAVLGGVTLPATANALTLAELIDLFIALEIIPADKAVQARSIVSQEQTTPSGACPFTWTRNMTVGASGADVKKLQEFLNGTTATRIADSGVGSPGKETTTFGPMTAKAVAKFQDIYASDILAPVGLTKGTGYFGSSTRAKANALCTTGAITEGTDTPVGGTIVDVPTIPLGTGLTITKAVAQPTNAIVPEGAARVPFTKFELSAGSADVTVTGIVVRREGLASNAGFAEVVLLDENGAFIGNPKTLNTDNEATLGGTFVVLKGTTKKVTVAGNMAAVLDNQAGEVPSLAVVAVNTASTITGSLPIVGAQHTLNGSLAIGGLSSVSRGALDPGTGLDKTVGITDYVFSSVKLTADSDEDLLLKSVRWYQSESASAEDVANVETIVDGVEYPSVRDGRHYVAVFPGTGISIKKGFSKDVSIKADIVSGSGRAIDFDIERNTDIHLVGTTYGYAVTPALTLGTDTDNNDDSKFRTSNNPYYDASQVDVSAGTMNVSGWTQVNAANVGTGILDTILGGLTVEVRGEPITVGSMTFSVTLTDFDGGAEISLADLTNVVVVDASGIVLAGPQDGSDVFPTGNIVFTDSATFPVGTTNVFVRGKLGSDFETNDTVTFSTDTALWTSVRGENTSSTIVPAGGAIYNQPMTVRGGALTITVSGQPSPQTVIAGAQNFEFARYILDAGQSSEDIRLTTIPLQFVVTGGLRTDLTSCKLYDGVLALNTGGNTKNPAVGESDVATTFTFDNGGFIVPKGSVKTLSLKCNLKTGTATNIYTWGIDGGQQATYSGASGISTGLEISETIVNGDGQDMEAGVSGGYEVATDGTLIYRLAQAGSTDVELARFRFTAGIDEDIILKKVALELNDGTSDDLANERVSIWNGATKIGEAQFGGATAGEAVAALSTPVTITRGDSVTLSIRGDLATHNAIEGTPGTLLAVGYNGDENGLDGNYGTGAASGITIDGTSGDVTSNGVRIFRTMPQVEDVTPENVMLMAGTDLYKVKITASNGRDVGIYSLAFNVSFVGTSLTVDDYVLWGPNGPVNSTPVVTGGASGDTDIVRIEFDADSLDRLITAGSSKTYRLKANTVTGLLGNEVETLTIALRADTAYPTVVLTGSIDPTASTAVVGVGTLFTTELAVGDRITVSGETRAVTAIADDTNLTVDTAFTDNLDDTSPERTNLMDTVVRVEDGGSTKDNFIWTPFSTESPHTGADIDDNDDWTNGYGVPGYPGVGQNMQVRVFSH